MAGGRPRVTVLPIEAILRVEADDARQSIGFGLGMACSYFGGEMSFWIETDPMWFKVLVAVWLTGPLWFLALIVVVLIGRFRGKM